MKKYIEPKIEFRNIIGSDVISCSFGELEELPAPENSPAIGFDQNIWDW